MSQLITTGRVVTDLELKSSAKQNLYIHFTLVERIGYGETARSQAMNVWAWGYLAEQLKRLGICPEGDGQISEERKGCTRNQQHRTRNSRCDRWRTGGLAGITLRHKLKRHYTT